MQNILAIVFFFLFSSFIPIVHACELQSGWQPYPPYQYVDKKSGELAGLDVDFIRAIFRRMPCKPIFSKIYWDAHLMRLKDGSLDFASSVSYSPAREEYAYYSASYRTERVNLYVLKGESNKYRFSSLSDIIGTSFKLGVTSGYYYGKEYADLIKNPEFREHVNETNVDVPHSKMLISGRVDGFLMDNIAAHDMMKEQKLLGKIEIHPMKVYFCDIHVMFSKKTVTTEIVEAFNNALMQLKNSEEYEKIIDRYRGINQ
ncbi:transporter substrate-binding domain-containing protein [Desulfobacterales bacterium HSG17]|nr:transporter substrate-binding domain-containing protein [Desulfobacterales bacterium HSG17]